MENVRYKRAVSYFVIIAEIETIDDSVQRWTKAKPDLNLPIALLSILSLISYAIPRNRFSILLCSYCVLALLPNALCHDLFITQCTNHGKRYRLSWNLAQQYSMIIGFNSEHILAKFLLDS